MSNRTKCPPYTGCRGEGWRNDLTDAGSGREVYCDCPAGDELKQKDDAEPVVIDPYRSAR